VFTSLSETFLDAESTTVLQRVSVARYAERCTIVNPSLCPFIRPSVCPSVTRWH